jgi:hypothetical protein
MECAGSAGGFVDVAWHMENFSILAWVGISLAGLAWMGLAIALGVQIYGSVENVVYRSRNFYGCSRFTSI